MRMLHDLSFVVFLFFFLILIVCMKGTGYKLLIYRLLHWYLISVSSKYIPPHLALNPLNRELNLICYLLALLGAHHFLHVSRIRVKLLTFRLLMSFIYGAPILDGDGNGELPFEGK